MWGLQVCERVSRGTARKGSSGCTTAYTKLRAGGGICGTGRVAESQGVTVRQVSEGRATDCASFDAVHGGLGVGGARCLGLCMAWSAAAVASGQFSCHVDAAASYTLQSVLPQRQAATSKPVRSRLDCQSRQTASIRLVDRLGLPWMQDSLQPKLGAASMLCQVSVLCTTSRDWPQRSLAKELWWRRCRQDPFTQIRSYLAPSKTPLLDCLSCCSSDPHRKMLANCWMTG